MTTPSPIPAPVRPASVRTPGVVNGSIYCSVATGIAGTAHSIVAVEPDGSGRRELTAGEYPGVSRDGSRVWFTRGSELWRMSPDGSGQVRIASLDGPLLTPAESPDGKLIALTYGNPSTGTQEVWVMSADGSGPHRLAAATHSASARDGRELRWAVHPSWSPDGATLVFASTDGGRSQVWSMRSDGSAPKPLIDGSGTEYPDSNVPEYSRDGTRITYWSGFEAEYGDVWAMDAEGHDKKRLTAVLAPRSADNPTWSPDGESVAFISNRDGTQSAWTVPSAGGEPRKVIEQASYCAWASRN